MTVNVEDKMIISASLHNEKGHPLTILTNVVKLVASVQNFLWFSRAIISKMSLTYFITEIFIWIISIYGFIHYRNK